MHERPDRRGAAHKSNQTGGAHATNDWSMNVFSRRARRPGLADGSISTQWGRVWSQCDDRYCNFCGYGLEPNCRVPYSCGALLSTAQRFASSLRRPGLADGSVSTQWGRVWVAYGANAMMR